MEKLIEIKNLTKNYHTINDEIKALDNISFNIYKNEILSLIGPSGCGKSTIMEILTNNINKSSGKIIKNKNLKISYMLQQDTLFPWLTIYENATLGLKLEKKLTKENINYVNDLLTKYGLKDFKDKYPENLSGGMRQRVALIRSIATKPDILLLDEPLSALDYQNRLILSNDLYKIIKENNITTLLITHDISEAISLSDRIIVLSKRPSKVKKTYIISLENKTNPIENRKDKNFNIYFDKIWEDINE